MRALEQQSIVRLTYAGRERERAREEQGRGERCHCSNIPCLTQHTVHTVQQYSSTGQDILLTRYIPTTHTNQHLALCTSATATTPTLQATHGNTPARARTSSQTRRSTRKRGLACLRQSDSRQRQSRASSDTRALQRKGQSEVSAIVVVQCSAERRPPTTQSHTTAAKSYFTENLGRMHC